MPKNILFNHYMQEYALGLKLDNNMECKFDRIYCEFRVRKKKMQFL